MYVHCLSSTIVVVFYSLCTHWFVSVVLFIVVIVHIYTRVINDAVYKSHYFILEPDLTAVSRPMTSLIFVSVFATQLEGSDEFEILNLVSTL